MKKWVKLLDISDALGVSNIRSVYNRAGREECNEPNYFVKNDVF